MVDRDDKVVEILSVPASDFIGNITPNQFPVVNEIMNGEAVKHYVSYEAVISLALSVAEKFNEICSVMRKKYKTFPTCRTTWVKDEEHKQMVKNYDEVIENTFAFVNGINDPYQRIIFFKVLLVSSGIFPIDSKSKGWKEFYKETGPYVMKGNHKN